MVNKIYVAALLCIVLASITIIAENLPLTLTGSELGKVSQNADGTYDVELLAPGTKISIQGMVTPAENINAKMDDYSQNQPTFGEITTKVFAIEDVKIKSAVIQLPKSGKVNRILRCNEFNVDSFNCQNWEITNLPFKDYGSYVEFTVTHFSAYAGGEINVTNAEHLDENYTFISNIFDEIKANDNIWSEPIYEHEIVRVTYEENLSDGSYIDVLARSNGTIAYFDIYEAGTTHLVGRSGSVDKPEIQYISVNGLTTPSNLFDFKIVKVVQDRQECLNLCNNDCTENPYEGCSEQCNNPCSDITFNANRTAFLEFDYIHDQAINSTNANGLVVYGELAIASPRYRLWNSSANDFSAEASALSIGTDGVENITWVVVKGNHQRDEFIMGTEDISLDVNIQIFDANAGTFGNLNEVSTAIVSGGSVYRAFDIGVEDLSGDALIVYENSAAGNTNFGWQVWNGTAYSGETNLTVNLASSAIRWVSLVPQKGTDNIMLVVHNGQLDIYAVPWNGTGFDTTKGIAPQNTTTSSTEEHFAFAWEASGQGLLAYGVGTLVKYLTYDPTTGWGTETEAFNLSGTDGLDALSMCSDPTSDNIGLIWQDSGNDVNALVWNGSEMLTGAPAEDATTLANGANNRNINCEWFNSTTALFGFSDTTRLMDWFTFTKPSTWSTSNLTASTGTTITFATGIIAGLLFSKHPTTNQLMVLTADTSFDISTIRWNGSAFQNVTTNPLETTDSVASTEQQMMAMFDWSRFDPVPSVINISPSGASYSQNEAVIINATIQDNLAVSVVLANVTLPNSTIELIVLTDDNSDNVYNATFTSTSAVGDYILRIIANDTSTHKNVNSTETANFNVTTAAGNCGTVTEDTTLTNNLTSNGTCFTIGADNVILDGAGYSITGNGSGNGVELNSFDNVTLKNLMIQDFDKGLLVENSAGAILQNNELNNAPLQVTSPVGETQEISYNNSYGKIRWNLANFNVSTNLAIGTNIFLEPNLVGLSDDPALSDLDTSAQIQIQNLSYNTTPTLLKNGVRCDNIGLCNISYDNATKILSANISSFSNYSSQGTTSCGIINGNINLIQDIIASGTCFTVNASNIIIDGNNHTIAGDGLGYGINITNFDGVTIKNFAGIDNFTRGIFLLQASNSTVVDNVITAANNTLALGIYLETNATNNNISRNNITTLGNGGYGILAQFDSDDNSIFFNTISTLGNTSAHGIYLASSDGNTVNYNNITIYGSAVRAIYLLDASESIILGNTLSTFGAEYSYGMVITSSSQNVTVRSNTITTTGEGSRGIDLSNSNGVVLDSNRITTSSVSTPALRLASSGDITSVLIINNNLTALLSNEIEDVTGSSQTSYLVYNNSFGEVKWTDESFLQNLTFNVDGGIGLGNNLVIGNNTLALNLSAFNNGRINSSVNITLHGLTFGNVNEIKRLDTYSTNATEIINNGVDCLGTSCEIISYSGGTLVFNSTSLGSFAVNEVQKVDVYNLSLLYTNTSHFSVSRFFIQNIDLISHVFDWEFDAGDGTIINSTQNVSLGSNENVLVFIEHGYIASGPYTIKANSSTTNDFDVEEKNVTVG